MGGDSDLGGGVLGREGEMILGSKPKKIKNKKKHKYNITTKISRKVYRVLNLYCLERFQMFEQFCAYDYSPVCYLLIVFNNGRFYYIYAYISYICMIYIYFIMLNPKYSYEVHIAQSYHICLLLVVLSKIFFKIHLFNV